MTTEWKPSQLWAGKTVYILGGGPSLSQLHADDVSANPRIVVNHAYTMAPDADMLVALDPDWNDAMRQFQGIRICGVMSDDLDAFYAGPMYERVKIGTNHTIEIRNSGLAAIRIAAQMGAKKIVLLGFDPDTFGHFDGYPDDDQPPGVEPYPGMIAGLSSIISELGSQGIVVEKYVSAVRKSRIMK